MGRVEKGTTIPLGDIYKALGIKDKDVKPTVKEAAVAITPTATPTTPAKSRFEGINQFKAWMDKRETAQKEEAATNRKNNEARLGKLEDYRKVVLGMSQMNQDTTLTPEARKFKLIKLRENKTKLESELRKLGQEFMPTEGELLRGKYK